MKANNLTREIILWAIVFIPLVYLAVVWNSLPEQVPVHFNLQGEADGWAGKTALVFIVLGTTALFNLIMLALPHIDPKRKLTQMGSKYHQLRFILVIFMAVLSVFLIHNALNPSAFRQNIHFVLIGGLFIALGNYFQAVKPNYFIGIRTPWTLESEQVWRKTHRLGGILWIIGGISLILLAFLPEMGMQQMLYITVIALTVLIPVAYSFIAYRRERRELGQQS
ncbi:SdpI family protein [Pontibacter sp. HSC-36F09]|uniref:SdpI family protein n=1 Tax=Pontibacter sp. HSC-36F09 TaxID=2910966 RepID=UPI0020A11A0B|nr:SdpI family protein [Pontibacter sp. HSC-36F09]MCP2043471.1 putative membrane protein [Pontibacter sp. HSC-36F09]